MGSSLHGFALPKIAMPWWRGPFTIANSANGPQLDAPLSSLEEYEVRFPPGSTRQGHPAYVWFGNASARETSELLDVVRAIGPLNRSFERKRKRWASWWASEESAAAFFRLALMCWFALQEHDSGAKHEVTDLLHRRLSSAESRGETAFGILDHGIRAYAEEFYFVNELAETGRPGWERLKELLQVLLGEVWDSIGTLHAVEVSAASGEVGVSVRYWPSGLFSLVGLQMLSDLSRGRRVRRCSNGDCQRNQYFVPIHASRLYCSRECQNVVMQRRHRERQKKATAGGKQHKRRSRRQPKA